MRKLPASIVSSLTLQVSFGTIQHPSETSHLDCLAAHVSPPTVTTSRHKVHLAEKIAQHEPLAAYHALHLPAPPTLAERVIHSTIAW